MENLADLSSEPEREPSYMFYNAGWVSDDLWFDIWYLQHMNILELI